MSAGRRLEAADVFREHAAEYQRRYGCSSEQRRVLDAVQNCRTAALGGHVEECDQCGRRRNAYNSCRNRHCPKCQGPAQANWMQARASELLPVPYFHVVFTLPDALGPLALQNKKVVYGALFTASSRTLQEVAANPKHLGARIGLLSVLHTWGQNLLHHPHVHCVVPSGGPALEGGEWIHGREDFLLPVRVLSRVFRGKFVALLKQAYVGGKLRFHGSLASLSDGVRFEELLDRSVRKEWVVYAKPPFGGPEAVLKYLARYTHRTAISNNRLIAMQAGRVSFRYKDYAHGGRRRVMTLDGVEFLRRFLMHVLPKGFVRIRHYGFLSNRDRKENLKRCRDLLGVDSSDVETADSISSDFQLDESIVEQPLKESARVCPECSRGRMHVVERLEPTLKGATRRRPTRQSRNRQSVSCHDTS